MGSCSAGTPAESMPSIMKSPSASIAESWRGESGGRIPTTALSIEAVGRVAEPIDATILVATSRGALMR